MARWLAAAVLTALPGLALADAESARRDGVRALVDQLEDLAEWCVKKKMYAHRNGVYEVVLEFDPDHREARKWLRYRRRKDGTWERRQPYREARNLDTSAEPEFRRRLKEILDRYADYLVEIVVRFDPPPAQRQRLLDEALARNPDDARARKLNGQVRSGGGWLLRDTVVARRRRRELIRDGMRAARRTPKPDRVAVSAEERALGLRWNASLRGDWWRCVATTGADEARKALQVADASWQLVEEVFDITLRPPEDCRAYLLSGDAEARRFVHAHREFDARTRKWILGLSGGWVSGRYHLIEFSPERAQRIDGVARQAIGVLLKREFGVTARVGWAWEGFGFYLGYLLTGTRLTFYVRKTRYAQERADRALWRLDQLQPVRLVRDRALALQERQKARPPLPARQGREQDDRRGPRPRLRARRLPARGPSGPRRHVPEALRFRRGDPRGGAEGDRGHDAARARGPAPPLARRAQVAPDRDTSARARRADHGSGMGRTGLVSRIAAGMAVALLLGTVGVTVYSHDQDFRRTARMAEGTVLSNVRQGHAYYPIVRFLDEDGSAVIVTTRVSHEVGGRPVFGAGEKVAIVYDPQNPAHARVDSVFDRWALPVLCTLGALLGLVFFVFRPRRAQPQLV